MASYQFFNHSNNNKVHISHSGQDIRGRSTTQMCLHKILHIISTFTPPETPKALFLDPLFDLGLRGEDNRGFLGIDLNIRLGSPPLEAEQSECPAENGGPACNGGGDFREVLEIDSPVVCTGSTTAEKDSGGRFDIREAVNLFGSDTREFEDGVVEETVIEVQRLKINNNGSPIDEEEKLKVRELCSERRLDLLIEAAKFISGGFEEGEPEPEKTSPNHELSGEYSIGKGSKRRKRSESWMVDDVYGEFEEDVVSPVVRSKRGRSQVLPYKYRDSVLEPLKPLSRHRSATVSTTKRRLR